MSKVEISKKLIVINSLSSIAARAVNVTCLLWSLQYLLRRIPKSEFDIYPVVMSVMVFLPLLTTALTAGVGRFIVEAYARGDEERVTEIASTMFVLVVPGAALLMAVGGLLIWQVDWVLNIHDRVADARIMLALVFLMVIVKLVAAPFMQGLYVRQRFVQQNLINIGCDLVNQAVLVTLLLGVSTWVGWVVVAMTVASVLNVAVTATFSRKLLPAARVHLKSIRPRTMLHLVTFNIWRFVGQVADVIQAGLVPPILKHIGKDGDPTSLYVGMLPNSKIGEFSGQVGIVLEPAMTAMHATGRDEQLGNTYVRGGRYRLWVTMFFATPLCVFAYEVVKLYAGNRYPEAAPIMVLMLLMIPVTAGNAMVGEVCYARGQLATLSKQLLLQNAIMLPLMLYLVKYQHMGAFGAAVAMASVTVVIYPTLWWRLGLTMARVRFIRWLRETMLPGLLPAACAAGLLLALRSLMPPQSWLALGLYAAAGCAVYVFVMFRCFQPCDRNDWSRAVAALKRRLRPTPPPPPA